MPRGIPNTKRVSREQETWSADAIHDDYTAVAEDEGPLQQNIPARPGFSQRWIRTKIGGEDDPQSISSAVNKGWKRRDPSTIPPEISAPSIYVDGVGESVGISGMILMERPQKYSDAYKAKVQQRTNAQMEAVNNALAETHAAEKGRGFGRPGQTEETKTVTQTGTMPVDD